MARISRWQEAARAAPPTAATGGFPYNRKSIAETPGRRIFAHCRALVRHGPMDFRKCKKDARANGYCSAHADRADA